MAFSRIKALGWAFGEILTSGQMTQLDLDHSRAVDGTGGGSYAGAINFSNLGTVTTTGDVTVGDDLVVTDDASVGGDLTVSGNVGAPGGATVTGLTSTNSDFFGTSHFHSPLLGDGTSIILGAGGTELVILRGDTIAITHRMSPKVHVPDASGGQTYSILDGNFWYLPDVNADRTWHLSNTDVGASITRWIIVSAQRIFDAGHGAHTFTIDFNGGANSIGLGSTGDKYAILLYDGTAWGVFGHWA